jgi:hypothetical protein
MAYLEELLCLKAQIKNLEEQVNLMMPDGIVEALELLGNEQENSTVCQSTQGKIVIRFHKKVDYDHPDMEKLRKRIQDEKDALANRHAAILNAHSDRIAQLQEQIELLRAKQEALIASEQLDILLQEYQELKANLQWLNPVLAFYLK